mmetsp:Transcript_8888/g.19228  ORF Transcript_8888/g.19228 Transcript_8888/m.19228 type:complete len:96 (-) Transcript_8888:84-371(-)
MRKAQFTAPPRQSRRSPFRKLIDRNPAHQLQDIYGLERSHRLSYIKRFPILRLRPLLLTCVERAAPSLLKIRNGAVANLLYIEASSLCIIASGKP